MGFKVGLIVDRGKPVPGTNFLADVASEYPVLHTTFKIFRNRALFLDSGIRNTFAPIQQISILVNGIRRARIDTPPAGSAEILNGLIIGQFDVHQELSQEKIGASSG